VPRKELSKTQRADGGTVLRPQLIPVIPTYPFIRFDIADGRAHEMFKIVGVYGLQCTRNRPVIIDDAYVDYLLGLETDGPIPASTSLKELFAIGTRVRVTSGPFRGFEGIVEELSAKLQQQIDIGVISELDESTTATIAIEVFGRATPVETPLRWFKKV
jgi:transcription antitermination factor NusG